MWYDSRETIRKEKKTPMQGTTTWPVRNGGYGGYGGAYGACGGGFGG
jgi:hypothetical protein